MTSFNNWISAQLDHHSERLVAALQTYDETLPADDSDATRAARRIAAEHASILIALRDLLVRENR